MKKSFNGNCITEFRDKNHMTQAKFAIKFNAYLSEKGIGGNYSNKSISMWENGNREPQNLDIIKALADFLGVSIDEICNNNEMKEPPDRYIRQQPDCDMWFSEQIEEFVFGNVQRIDAETITSSFWQFVSVEYFDLESYIPMSYRNSPSCFDMMAKCVEDITERLKDAEIVDINTFRCFLCDYVLSVSGNIIDGNDLYEYLFVRFDKEYLRQQYECFLSCDLDSYTEDRGIDKIDIENRLLNAIYTSKGLLVQLETTAHISQENFNMLYRECCESSGLGLGSGISSKNKMTADSWIS